MTKKWSQIRRKSQNQQAAPTPFSQEQQDLFTLREDVRKLKIRELEDAVRAIQQFLDEIRYTRF